MGQRRARGRAGPSRACTLSWTMERIARNPEAASRLHTAALDDDDAYVDAVFTETLRVRPVLPFIVRPGPRRSRRPQSRLSNDGARTGIVRHAPSAADATPISATLAGS